MNIQELLRLVKTVKIDGLSKIGRVHQDILKYGRGFMVSYAVSALLNSGVIEAMEREGGIEPSQYARRKHLDIDVLLPLCEYMYALGIFDKRGSSYVLGKVGQRLTALSIGVFDMLHAYSPIFQNLEELLTRKKDYGADVRRHTEYVAKGSTEITRYLPFPAAKRLIEKHAYRAVLDLGCGDGAFLFDVCEGDRVGVGIDLAEGAIRKAAAKSVERGLQNQLKFLLGDIFEIGKIRDQINSRIQVVSMMFVLHEFLYGGQEKVLKVLQGIQQNFPDSDLLVCEICESPPEDLRRNPTAACELHLYHRLSRQGIGTAQVWRQIFSKAGYQLKDEVFFRFAEQGYFILHPDPAKLTKNY